MLFRSRSPGEELSRFSDFTPDGELNLDSYRIFSQLKSRQLPDDETLPNDLEAEDEMPPFEVSEFEDRNGFEDFSLSTTPREI